MDYLKPIIVSQTLCNPGKKNGMIHILNFGRIVPSKGINILVEAVRILQNKYSIHLTIAGSGDAYFDFKGQMFCQRNRWFH